MQALVAVTATACACRSTVNSLPAPASLLISSGNPTFRALLNQNLSRKEKSFFSFLKLHSKKIDVKAEQKLAKSFKSQILGIRKRAPMGK